MIVLTDLWRTIRANPLEVTLLGFAFSVIVAFARSAMRRCVAIGMTRSSVPKTAQLGIDFHAGAADGVTFATNEAGLCVATIVHRSASGRSWAKAVCTVSGLRNASAAPSGAPG